MEELRNESCAEGIEQGRVEGMVYALIEEEYDRTTIIERIRRRFHLSRGEATQMVQQILNNM